MKAASSSSNVSGVSFNVACGDQISLNEVVEFLKSSLNLSDINLRYGPSRKGDIMHSNASIEKIKEILHYNPDYSFSDGIAKTIEWYKEVLK